MVMAPRRVSLYFVVEPGLVDAPGSWDGPVAFLIPDNGGHSEFWTVGSVAAGSEILLDGTNQSLAADGTLCRWFSSIDRPPRHGRLPRVRALPRSHQPMHLNLAPCYPPVQSTDRVFADPVHASLLSSVQRLSLKSIPQLLIRFMATTPHDSHLDPRTPSPASSGLRQGQAEVCGSTRSSPLRFA